MKPVEYVRRQLELKCAALGSQKRFSQKHHVSLPYVNDVLNGRREPGEKILKALKMKRVTGYVYVSVNRKGASMTRKEELVKVAQVAVNTFQNGIIDGPFVLPSGHKDDLIQRIYVVLLQLERKVWGKVIDKIETEMDKENESTDDQVWEIRDWCKQQKEAL